jgi:serine protease Do
MLRLSTWTLVMATLMALVVLPHVAERVQYAITRGDQLAKAEVARRVLAEVPEGESRLAYVAHSVAPSVVGIETTQISRNVPSEEGNFLFRPSRRYRTEGFGSGVIVDPDGYVLTNDHVIAGASEITVKLSDGTPVTDVKVIGRDPLTDLALLKIESAAFTTASWGDSNDLEAGDAVLAIGNPYGLERTVTSGIISATGRLARIAPLIHQDFLQTDAAVNPGNSGGPLVNMQGQVVGINTAIYGEQNLGISFAIPSVVAQDVYKRLREDGHIPRGWLGVYMQDVDEQVAEKLELLQRTGALVTQVERHSPAARAGVQPFDVIVGWNDTRVENSTDVSRAVAGTKIGSDAVVVVLRDGARVELDVRVGERPLQMD